MGEYNIRIFPIAQNDLRNIVEYLNTLSPDAAVKYYDMIVDGVMSLSSMPTRHPLCRDQQLRLCGYRALFVKNCIVFYVINGDTAEICRMLYSKRHYQNLL